jgi:hypothetical protein
MDNLKIKWFHIPKASGTSIFNMTQNWKNFKRAHPNENHVQAWKYPPNKDEIGLTIIRHPYSRFLSAFWHMVDACDINFYYRNAPVSDCNTMKKMGIDFGVFENDPNVFLQALMEKIHPHHKTAQIIFHNFSVFKPQFYWLSDKYKRHIHPDIKMILHQENIEEEFEKVAELLGHEIQWPRGRESNKRISRKDIQLNNLSKSILQSLYSDDFNHLSFTY